MDVFVVVVNNLILMQRSEYNCIISYIYRWVSSAVFRDVCYTSELAFFFGLRNLLRIT